jgi:hypothetical protein
MKKQIMGIGCALLLATGATAVLARGPGGGAAGGGAATGAVGTTQATGGVGTLTPAPTGPGTPGATSQMPSQTPGINTTTSSSSSIGNTPVAPGSPGQTIPGQPGTSGTQVPGTLPPTPGFPGGVPQPAPGFHEPAGADVQPGNMPVPNNPATQTPRPGVSGGTGVTGAGQQGVVPNLGTTPNNIQTAPPLQGAPLPAQQPPQ